MTGDRTASGWPFHSTRSGYFDVYTIRADGTGLLQTTDSSPCENCPDWTGP